MRHTKAYKTPMWILLVMGGLLGMCILTLHPWRVSIQTYFKQTPNPFELIVQHFSEQPPPRGVLLIERADINNCFADVEVELPTEVQTSIRQIFQHTDCKMIFLSGNLDYCEFSTSNRSVEHGIVYLHAGKSGPDPLLGQLTRTRLFLSEHWMYYEVLTPLSEQAIHG